MENQLQVFNSDEFGQVRVVMRDGEPWFIAADVCRVLEIKNVSDALNRLDEDEKNTIVLTEGIPGNPTKAIVNESGLYALTITSRKPKAKDFRKWLTGEVAVSIRKTGMYINPQAVISPDFLRRIADTLEAKDKQIAEQGKRLDEFQPKVDYYAAVLDSDNAIPVTVIAKEYGMSGVTFNKLLNSERVQFMRGNVWVLYRQYDRRGYTVTKTFPYEKDKSTIHTYWTEKGREFLYHFLKARGIVPIRERPKETTLFEN